jgi:hypothetical protein
MSLYNEMATKIIKEQELLMGPVAWYEARKVPGLQSLDEKTGQVIIDEKTDNIIVVDNLVKQYGSIFGRAAVEVCRDAVTAMIADLPASQIPSILR